MPDNKTTPGPNEFVLIHCAVKVFAPTSLDDAHGESLYSEIKERLDSEMYQVLKSIEDTFDQGIRAAHSA